MERKWNGKFMQKIVDRKWNGNRVEMERIWNGKKEREVILANGIGNGMEIEKEQNGILGSQLWNLSIGILRIFYQCHLEPFHQIPFHSMEFHFPFKNADLQTGETVHQKGPLILFILRYIKHYTHIYLYIYIYQNCPDSFLVGLKFWTSWGSG